MRACVCHFFVVPLRPILSAIMENRDRHIDIARSVAIILVVLGHIGVVPGCEWLEAHFPIYSYHMALFLCISGYLFRDMDWSSFPTFLKKKSLRLLLPLIGWNIAYAAIVTLFNHWQLVHYLPPTEKVWTFYNLFIAPFMGCDQYFFNHATWFVGMLYPALLVYALIFLISRRLPEWSILVLYFCIAIAAMCVARFCDFPQWALLPLHIAYALFFLQVGRCWRIWIEPLLNRINIWFVMIGVLVVWFVVQLFGGHTCVVAWMNFGGYILIPLLTGVLGSVSWILISMIFSQYIRANRLETLIGTNTWSIMAHHLTVRFVVCYLFVRFTHDTAAMASLQDNFWYRSHDINYWVYVAAMIILPILWQLLFNRLKSLFVH